MRSALTDFLVDTNILVYAYDPADPEKQNRARLVLSQLAGGSGSVSAQILGECFVTLTRKLRPPLSLRDAEENIEAFVRNWRVFDLTDDVVLEAIRAVQRHQLSYWDALIWATAKRNGVPAVLSEAFSDGRLIESVLFRNPLLAKFTIS